MYRIQHKLVSRLIERFRMVPMVIVMGTIFYFSHQSGDSIDLSLFTGMDKVIHCLVYGVLSCSVLMAHRSHYHKQKPTQAALNSFMISGVFALSDEFHQSFIPGRMVSFGDILADMIGAAIVALLYLCLCKAGSAQERAL